MIFVVLAEHNANECATSNARTREMMLKTAPEIPKMAERHGVKMVAGPYVNWEHVTVMIAECDKVESLWRFVAESGLEQWNRVRMIPSQHLSEGIKEVERAKPLF